MSYIFLPGPEAASSLDSCLDTDASVLSSGMNTLKPSWFSDSAMASSNRFLSGPMCKLLTEGLGEELLTLWLAAFHAKTFLLPDQEQASPESEVECGRTWPGLLAKYDPVLCLWKTVQSSLLEDLEQSLETWPRSGMTVNGQSWELPMSELRTSETESGFWPTPTASSMPCEGTQRIMRKKWLAGEISLEEASAIAGRDIRKAQGKVPMWPTPNAGDAKQTGNVEIWMRRQAEKSLVGIKLQKSLAVAVAKWPTPSAGDGKGSGKTGTCRDRLDYATERGQTKTQTYPDPPMVGGKLNPMWVEKLMGWPDDFTSLNPISHVKLCFWLMGMHNGAETGSREVLRVLRFGYAAQEIQREIGRPIGIHEAAFLLAELCEHANRLDAARVFMACAEALEGEMRGVQPCKETASAPHQPGQNQQRSGEHPDAVQALSRLLAHHGQTYWQDGRWEDAIPRVVNGMAHRALRLKCIGNGQVPAVAAAAFNYLLSEI
jgi:hypothetical protein